MTSAVMDMGLPEKFEFVDHGSHIEITRKWFGSQFLFLTGFVIFWCGFLFFWYSSVPADAPLLMTLFPIGHVAVGIGLGYYVLAGWLNRTTIVASHQQLGVRHSPIPWFGAKDIAASDLKQLYAKEKVSRSRNSTSVTYEVRAVTHSGKNVKIVSGLENQEQAFFIEQKIEHYLGIENVAVRGEVGNS